MQLFYYLSYAFLFERSHMHLVLFVFQEYNHLNCVCLKILFFLAMLVIIHFNCLLILVKVARPYHFKNFFLFILSG